MTFSRIAASSCALAVATIGFSLSAPARADMISTGPGAAARCEYSLKAGKPASDAFSAEKIKNCCVNELKDMILVNKSSQQKGKYNAAVSECVDLLRNKARS